jgi:very-short-patch-repair endonuclease
MRAAIPSLNHSLPDLTPPSARKSAPVTYDRGRSEVLERLGVQIVRFTNEEVCGDLDAVLERIQAALRLPFA